MMDFLLQLHTKGLIASLIKGNQWSISPKHKALLFGGGWLTSHNLIWVLVSNSFYYHPYYGEDFQFDEHIFQMGWLNLPENDGKKKEKRVRCLD